MLKNKALKSELAGAALAFGILGASPSFAQDESAFPVQDTAISSQTISAQREWSIDPYNPLVPDYLFWTLCALAAAGGGYQIARRKDGGLSRTMAMAAGLVVLANPELVTDEVRTHASEYLILVDTSETQGLDGRDSLSAQAYARLESDLGAAVGSANIRMAEFGNDGEGTMLNDVLRSSLQKIPAGRLGGVFILSDGVIQDISSTLDIGSIGAPVHALVSGTPDEQDVFIRIDSAPRFVGADDGRAVSFYVGGNLDAQVSVTVSMNLNGESVYTTTLPLNSNGSFTLPELPSGDNMVELSITSLRGADGSALQVEEVTLENNRISTSVERVGEPLQILLLSGAPYQGTTAWRDLLVGNPDYVVTHFAQLRPGHKEDATPLRDLATSAMPVHEIFNDRLAEYDVIIFDKSAYSGEIPLSYMQAIVDAVERGASLLVVGGEELAAANSLANTALGQIMPLQPDSGVMIERAFTPHVTDAGERHPLGRMLLQGVPASDSGWGAWYSAAMTRASDGASVVLDDGAGNPLLGLSRYGEGRVAVLASDQNWLWIRGGENTGPGAALYRNLVGWLAGEDVLDEENVSLRREEGMIVVELQTMGDAPETVTLTTPSGTTIEVTPESVSPGLRRAFVPVAEAGLYKVERAGEHPDFAFAQIGFSDALEMQEVVSRLDLVAPLTERHDGVTARMSAADGVLSLPPLVVVEEGRTAPDGTMGIRTSTDHYISGNERNPLIPYSPLPEFFAFLAFLGLALKREGSKGKTWGEALDINKLKFWDKAADAQDNKPRIPER